MKSLKNFVLETLEDELDEKICTNIEDELNGMGVECYYVETGMDEEEKYPMVYVATCNYKYFKLWKDIAASTEVVNLVENVGVEIVRVNSENITYNGKKAFEIIFADTQAD